MITDQELINRYGPYAGLVQSVKENPASLIPGYSLYEWFKEDKSKIWPDEKGLTKILHNSAVYTGAAVRDTGLALIYYAIGAGLVKLTEETIKFLK
jgi:hypothetical protein